MGQLQTIGKVATSVKRDEMGILRVTYHATDVVTVFPDGEIVLNTGGYFSHTTKARMNQASNQFGLGFQVWQKNFAWFVDCDGETIPFNSTSVTLRKVGN
jgi:hypothetical protein